ncbi:hypothetical protein LXL04_038671 [Taraxacum kok-saghyz]
MDNNFGTDVVFGLVYTCKRDKKWLDLTWKEEHVRIVIIEIPYKTCLLVSYPIEQHDIIIISKPSEIESSLTRDKF